MFLVCKDCAMVCKVLSDTSSISSLTSPPTLLSSAHSALVAPALCQSLHTPGSHTHPLKIKLTVLSPQISAKLTPSSFQSLIIFTFCMRPALTILF